MRISRGKQFENRVREAFEAIPQTAVMRLFDPTAGFKGVANICDFVVYHAPTMFCIECKSCYDNTLPLSNITDTQKSGLYSISRVPGVVAGYMIWFVDHDKTIFLPAMSLRKLEDRKCKSVNITKLDNDLNRSDYFVIDGRKARVLFQYDFSKFFAHYCK